jgi:Fur family ferric uptake transcriptional regulator
MPKPRRGTEDESRDEPLIRRIESQLTALGYRVTEPRRQLLRLMGRLGDHFELEEVTAEVPAASRSTVFRTLRLLEDLDIVCRVRLRDGGTAWRFAGAMPHHHVTCVDCGAIREVSHDHLDEIVADIARSLGYELKAHRLDLFGHCDDCPERTDLAVRAS